MNKEQKTEQLQKEVPVIKATKVERIEHADGRVDVTITVPRLALKNILKQREEQKQNG